MGRGQGSTGTAFGIGSYYGSGWAFEFYYRGATCGIQVITSPAVTASDLLNWHSLSSSANGDTGVGYANKAQVATISNTGALVYDRSDTGWTFTGGLITSSATSSLAAQRMAVSLFWHRELKAEEHLALHENPWQVFKISNATFYSLPSRIISAKSAGRVVR
jgi:hypothetical protein